MFKAWTKKIDELKEQNPHDEHPEVNDLAAMKNFIEAQIISLSFTNNNKQKPSLIPELESMSELTDKVKTYQRYNENVLLSDARRGRVSSLWLLNTRLLSEPNNLGKSLYVRTLLYCKLQNEKVRDKVKSLLGYDLAHQVLLKDFSNETLYPTSKFKETPTERKANVLKAKELVEEIHEVLKSKKEKKESEKPKEQQAVTFPSSGSGTKGSLASASFLKQEDKKSGQAKESKRSTKKP